mgnify:CR=1 FL=1
MRRSQRARVKSKGMFANLVRGLFGGDTLSRGDADDRKRRKTSHRRLRFEGCEERRLLTVTINWANPVLTLTSDGASDAVSVLGRATYVDIFVNNNFQARLQTANANNVNEIRFNGGGGTDSLTVQGIQPTGTLAIGSLGNALAGVENLTVVNGNNLTIHNGADPLNFGTSKFNGTLTVTSGGSLTQTGALTVTGTATFTVTGAGSDITLDNAANNFNNTVAITASGAGQDVALRDVNGIVLANVNVGGNLSIVANNNSTKRVAIAQTGASAVTVGGSTSLTVGSASTITLNNTGNDFHGAGGSLAVTAGANATLRDAGALNLGASNLTGNLTVTAGGDVTDAGNLVVGKVASFTVPAGFDIALDEANNDFGTVAATATGGGASVTINDLNALVLGPISTTDLTVTTDGAITQKAALSVTGTAAFTAGPLNDITLNKSTNDFNVVHIVSADDVNLRDSNNIQIAPDGGTSTVSGDLTVTAGGAITDGTGNVLATAGKTTLKGTAITLDSATNNFNELAITSGTNVSIQDADALILAASKISGTLAVQTGGELSQSGALSVKSGTTTLVAGANNVVLNHAGNDFQTVVITSAGDVALRDLNAVVLGASNVTGDLTVQANLNASNRLAISQSAPITVGGSTTLEAGSKSTITLNNAGNELHGGAGNVSVVGGGSVTLRDATAVRLGASTLTGNLSVTSGGDVTQDGPLAIAKTATFAAGANNITLDDADNDFGALAVTSAANVTVNDKNALILGASSVTNALAVTTNGAITQSGPLAIGGTATLSAGAANDIVLLNAANDFSSVGVGSGRNVALRDANAVDLALATISGTLGVTADGDITDSGALDVAGKATLKAGPLNDITLDETNNNLGEVAVVSALNVVLVNSDALILAASTISGTLDVTLGAGASGGITQSGALAVVGTATFDAPGNEITLTNSANNFSTVAIITATNASLRDINAIELGSAADGLTVTGDLAVTAGGAITDGGTLDVGGLTTLATSPLANITLDTAANAFAGAVSIASANHVALNAAGGLVLGASTISGALSVTLAGVGDLTQVGALTVAGTTTLNALATNNIDLSDPGNNFAAVSVVSGNNVTLADANDVDLGAMTVAGALSVSANGSITDSGVLSVAGDSTFKADADGDASGDIVLNSVSSFTGALSVQGGVNVQIYNNIATRLGNLFATGDLTITGNDDLDNGPWGGPYGIVSVVGNVKLDIGANDMSLNQNGWSYGTLTLICGTLTPLP